MEDILLVKLYDIYKGLLTEKQSQLFYSYYLFDLSLSEIAEVEGTSRQSVYDALKIVKQKLIDYENVLGILDREEKLSSLLEEINDQDIKIKIKEILDK